jgi:hypothetical protein
MKLKLRRILRGAVVTGLRDGGITAVVITGDILPEPSNGGGL